MYLTDKPIDKAAMTAALKKQRKASALTFGTFLDGMAKAKLEIVDGKVTYLYRFCTYSARRDLI